MEEHIRMQFVYTDGRNSDFIELCHGLDHFLNELVGGEENRAEYIPYNQLDDIHDVIIVYDDDNPVGSASFKKYDDECAEVKRVFIKQDYRGRGISYKLMERLENVAKEQGYRYLILESGEPLVAAMALYRKIGYKVIPNYGQYKDMHDSICMKKKL
ncbi:MAG: GNAT family N-acetyltransferase [Lachnospiraceae bacterium]|nr:GNAT family N-acetyltransferase [Lachnospiraceae bacterium]